MIDKSMPLNFKKELSEISEWLLNRSFFEGGDIFSDQKLFISSTYKALEAFLNTTKTYQNFRIELLKYRSAEDEDKLCELNNFLSYFLNEESINAILQEDWEVNP